MRLKRKLLLKVLCSIFTCCLIINSSVFSVKAEEDNNWLHEPEEKIGNSLNLSWETPDSNKYYEYRVFLKHESDVKFKSVPSKSSVKVLNIYPTLSTQSDEDGNLIPMVKSINYTDRDGNKKQYPQSAGLKKWMEESSKDDKGKDVPNGFGCGKITVDCISINEFNNDPYYLKKDGDENGDWLYDVIMIGSADYNGNRDGKGHDISDKAATEIQKFIQSGRGVLFGHDVISPINMNFANKFRRYAGISLGNETNTTFIKSTKIKVKKKGLLTNGPWFVGEEGTELTIPVTHNQAQMIDVNGDQEMWNDGFNEVWMSFADAKTGNSESISNEYGEQNVYLTTRNNTAMIQTGHSIGHTGSEWVPEPTSDEKKLLANTLFYLGQVTESTECEVKMGDDKDVPSKPEIINVVNNEDTVTVKFSEAKDNGTNYEYYVEAKEKNNKTEDNTVKSNVVKGIVTSGLKGYSIVVDQNEGTVPDANIETTSTDYTFDKTYKSDFYIHVAAVDNVGNISKVSTYTYSLPTLELTPNTTEEVKDKVIITAKAKCENHNIDKIITPDGKEVTGDTCEYSVDTNGSYEFIAVDDKGDKVRKSIDINNIKPDIILNVETISESYLNQDFVVNIELANCNDVKLEDVRIKYDSTKLMYLGLSEVTGSELLGKKDKDNGDLRFILSNNIIEDLLNKNKTILKLYFRGVKSGEALIDVTRSEVKNEDGLKKMLREGECGQTVINITERHVDDIDDDYEF